MQVITTGHAVKIIFDGLHLDKPGRISQVQRIVGHVEVVAHLHTSIGAGKGDVILFPIITGAVAGTQDEF
jgi:hypothetical protein